MKGKADVHRVAAAESRGRHGAGQAREIGPDCQIAGVALSAALLQIGRRGEAQDVAQALARTGPSTCEDPWWSYHYGQAWRLELELAALREAVRP